VHHEIAEHPAPVAPAPATPAPVVTTIPLPPAIDTPPPPPAKQLTAQLGRVDVQGAISQSTVRRAVERVLPAVRACTTTTAQTLRVHFTIDESRKAQRAHAATNGSLGTCVAAALATVRSDTPPDVGDAEVDVELDYK
jgi:hypothetical protein